MSSRSPSLVAGLHIGGYELVRRIGRGGMAEVWCAKRVSERRTSKFVAIKVVADQYVGDPRYQRMFRTEAELSGLLNHANIVQVFDEGEDDGRSYLVMEWVDGVNLLKVSAALTFVQDEATRHEIIAYIVGQLLHALGYAHGVTLHDGNPLGIVHRDVSPQNVLVSNHGEVKLTDFGVAHHLLEESSGLHVKGKVRYMAPDQLSGQARDPRIDLYAVGAILHEMLDGRRFRHHVEDQREMYLEVLSGHVPALGRAVPRELDVLRCALLQPDPSNRPPNAEAALELLERFPGYGDARRDLAQLCAGLTGVMRPRVGPGTSQAYASASDSSGARGGASPSRSPTPAASHVPLAKTPVASSVGSPPWVSPAPATPKPRAAHGEPWASPAVSGPSSCSAPESAEALPAEADPERPPSITVRLTPDASAVPLPIPADTSPHPFPGSGSRGPGPVRGRDGEGVAGPGARLGVEAPRGTAYGVLPDASVMTTAMTPRAAGPSGPSGEAMEPPNEVSTVTSLGRRASTTFGPGSNPVWTMAAPRRNRRRASIGALLSFFLLGSLGMAVVFVAWGEAILGKAEGLVGGRTQEDVERGPVGFEPPSASPVGQGEVPEVSPAAMAEASTSSGSGSSDAAAEVDEACSSSSGAPEDVDQDPSTTTSDAFAAEQSEPVAAPSPEPPQRRSAPLPPKEHSGLIVAVDGADALQVRVGSGKPRTIKSRESWTFRVAVGKGRKVQWKRPTDAEWTSHRVDVQAKCELQLRVPSKKTMLIGPCK